jgi:hypothetical protein
MNAQAQPMFSEEFDPYVIHDVNSIEIRQRRHDGYIDATAMGKVYGTDFAHFERTAEAIQYIAALADKLHICSSKLVIKIRGRYAQTFIHPQIAIRFAIQLDAAFAVDVTGWVLNYWRQSEPDLTGTSFQTRRLAAEIGGSGVAIDNHSEDRSPADLALILECVSRIERLVAIDAEPSIVAAVRDLLREMEARLAEPIKRTDCRTAEIQVDFWRHYKIDPDNPPREPDPPKTPKYDNPHGTASGLRKLVEPRAVVKKRPRPIVFEE